MTSIKCLVVVATLLVGFTTYAQQPAQTEENTNAGQQANPSGQATSATQQHVTDTSGTASHQAAAAVPDSINTAGNGQPASTPTVSQSTSSSSGSPAVLSGRKGNGRDGTNNVQRATMNMAGSPAGNLDLDADQTVDVDSELRDRQDRSQEKEVSAQKSQGGNEAGTGETNENTRKENNALSDQNLSSRNKNNQDSVNDKGNRKKENKPKKRNPVSKEKG